MLRYGIGLLLRSIIRVPVHAALRDSSRFPPTPLNREDEIKGMETDLTDLLAKNVNPEFFVYGAVFFFFRKKMSIVALRQGRFFSTAKLHARCLAHPMIPPSVLLYHPSFHITSPSF